MFFPRWARRLKPTGLKVALPRAGRGLAPPQSPIYLGGYRALAGLNTGHKIFVDTRDVGIAAHLLWEGRWEPWVDHHLVAAVEPGMVVCDIGASFGYYTLLMAEKTGPAGLVHAFEPNPRVARLLRQSVAVNGFAPRVAVHALALGAAAGALFLHVDEEFQGGGYLDAAAARDGLEAIPVQVRRLDQVLPPDRPVGLLKVDVEGFEDAVMQGAGDLLSQHALQAVLIEFRRPSEQAGDLPAYIRLLLDRGMTATALEPEGPQPLADLDAVMAIPLAHLTNILFRMPARAA